MSAFRDLVQGFTERVRAVVTYEGQAVRYNTGSRESGRIERLCREVGWTVDEYTSAGIELYFNGADGDRRRVLIQNGDGPLVTFIAFSWVMFDERAPKLPAIMSYLLQRNMGNGGVGKWGMSIDNNNKAFFCVMYQALGDGLSPLGFKAICEALVTEGMDFDAKLREEGLAR